MVTCLSETYGLRFQLGDNMPVITMCSTKGGVGKSTIALILAQSYAAAGSRVTLIDADPNQPLATWAHRFAQTVPKNLTVIGDVTEQNIIDVIDMAAMRDPFVIVDLEGSANMTASYSISRADLVLIPLRGKQLDADQASRVIGLVGRESRAYRRDIPYAVVFSLVSTLRSREYRHIRAAFEEKGIPILPVEVTERAAFSAMFQLGGTLFELTEEDVSQPQMAIGQAKELSKAVLAMLPKKEAA